MSDNPKCDQEKYEERYFEVYKLMIQAKNFHHESYTKWMNFFYVAEAAVLFAYTMSPHVNKLMLSLLGFVFSLVAYLSCKGFYFWTHNWTDQVCRLEKDFNKELMVYSVFSEETELKDSSIVKPLRPANLSTSKLTILFFLLIYGLWTLLLARNILHAKNILIVLGLKVNVGGVNSFVYWGVLVFILLLIPLLVIYLCSPWLKSNWFVDDDNLRRISCRDKKEDGTRSVTHL